MTAGIECAIPLEWETVSSTCQRATDRFVELLRSAPDAQASVPGLDWTVAQVAAHVVSLTARYVPFVQGQGKAFYATMPEMNAHELDALSAFSLDELADRLEAGTASLLSLCPSGRAPARLFDLDSDCTSAIALYVEELLVHGLDIARAVGRTWSITHDEAVIAIGGLTVPLPKFVDPQSTRGMEATYELRLRGGPTCAMTVADGAVSFSPGPAPNADCRISADPVAFLLTGADREPEWKALLGGKMVAFGRKPWLALRFKKLFVKA
ncbi:uncharacterized protein (TIGR03083 family) [Mycobacterium sp. OAS707]|uniref:maleylpyruvate isomerase family mycothiol-dependent enzyme n=1 Tax=Mycobacterium sp. OAS707 TaxID=2663822 RepID=UPI00178BD95A|nr:maleylpyruvate isomerase family mycothiol-dependent enzyme [Mycobacterium sp. OAS707]MBE1551091.1 uncharacterized protein (TIGR03083 family) [Mycobacterium sp. OAS707]